MSGHTAVESQLVAQGVFKGAHGLEGLANASDFWERQPYGTRLEYGPGITDYLHRGVLTAAIKALEESAAMRLALDLIAAGVAEIQRDVTTRFVYHDGIGATSSYVDLGWSKIIEFIGWDRAREALAAAKSTGGTK